MASAPVYGLTLAADRLGDGQPCLLPPSPQSWHLPAARSQHVIEAIFNPT